MQAKIKDMTRKMMAMVSELSMNQVMIDSRSMIA